jgi:hypothetical protein
MSLKSAFYGDTMRWFIGVVEETGSDKPKLGRVKVRIHGVHGDASEVSTADLPHAQVLVPTTEEGVSGFGANPNLMVGAQVFGMFLDGSTSQLPLVLGSIPKVEVPSREQVENIIYNPITGAIIRNTRQGINVAYTHTVASTPGVSNLEITWDFFIAVGFPPIAVAAMLGNFWVESFGDKFGDLDPKATNGVDFGIAQWGATRLVGLKQFATKNPWYGKFETLTSQLFWIEEELREEYKSAMGVKDITNVADATVFWQHRYEKNAYEIDYGQRPPTKVPSKYIVQNMYINKRLHEARRVHHAERIYKQFTSAKVTA